mmetsp:Transcript_16205/g.23508  ORF Transcript_16205/g.23508 Transcript_16205/m.23508 type:complete len:212 (-) Transcript_16205:52-687(-)
MTSRLRCLPAIPRLLLWWNPHRAPYSSRWIHQEVNQNLPHSLLRPVRQPKRFYAVLKRIRKAHAPTGATDNIPFWLVKVSLVNYSVHRLNATVIVLFVVRRFLDSVSEAQSRLRDVLRGIVVDPRRHDVLVLHSLHVPGAASIARLRRSENDVGELDNHLQSSSSEFNPVPENSWDGIRRRERWLNDRPNLLPLFHRPVVLCVEVGRRRVP